MATISLFAFVLGRSDGLDVEMVEDSGVGFLKTHMASPSSFAPTLGNPAVVGLAGFGLTTLILQLHNLGFVGLGPVIWLGFIFGGLAQLVAGFQEMKTGNNFGYCAFTSYGAFWIALCAMLLAGELGLLVPTATDVGWFLIAWTLLSGILWVGALRIHGAMALTFTLLMIGFVLLDLGHFGFPILNQVAAFFLIPCALCAWYMMARIILNEIYGYELLPAGRPWIRPRAVGAAGAVAKRTTLKTASAAGGR